MCLACEQPMHGTAFMMRHHEAVGMQNHAHMHQDWLQGDWMQVASGA
jgi:hypothetical protein